jgi:hypothetical protein
MILYNNFAKISSDRVAGFLQPMGRNKSKKPGKKLFLLSPLNLKNYFLFDPGEQKYGHREHLFDHFDDAFHTPVSVFNCFF